MTDFQQKNKEFGCAPPIENYTEFSAAYVIGIDPRHRLNYLSLLPSGSDEVRNRLLRGDRSERLKKQEKPFRGNSAPHKRISGKGHR